MMMVMVMEDYALLLLVVFQQVSIVFAA